MQGGGTASNVGMALLPVLAGVAAGVATWNPAVGMAVGSGVAAAEGAYMQVQATNAQQKQANIQAQQQQDQVDAQLRTANLQAAERSAAIRKQLLATLGEQDAVLASRGITLGGGGTAGDLRAEAERSSEKDFQINRLNWGAEQATADFARRQIKIGQSWSAEQAGYARGAAYLSGASGVAQAGYAGYTGWKDGQSYTGPRKLTRAGNGMAYGGV